MHFTFKSDYLVKIYNYIIKKRKMYIIPEKKIRVIFLSMMLFFTSKEENKLYFSNKID